MPRLTVATCPGSGLDIIRDIAESAGFRLIEVESVTQAKTVTFDRLLLLGGADIWPGLYMPGYDGRSPSTRDLVEWQLLSQARKAHRPIFGICRGHQFIAAAHGGSLYRDIPTETGKPHDRDPHLLQDVDPILRRYMPTVQVNTYHHQGVKRMPAGFRVLARAGDGIIESIGAPGILGVQFHPEFLYSSRRVWAVLFAWWLDGFPGLCQQPALPLFSPTGGEKKEMVFA